jgi:hypothetical protein
LAAGDAPVWEQEVFKPPGNYGAALHFDWARVRSAVAGKPAQVTLTATTEP